MATNLITRPSLRTQRRLQLARTSRLRLTVVFHPDLERIGAYCDLGEWLAGDVIGGQESVEVGRLQPLFSDGRALEEVHVSRRSLRINPVLPCRSPEESGFRIEALPDSDVRIGHSEADFFVADATALIRGVPLRLGHGVVLLLRMISLDDWSVSDQRCPGVIGASPETGLLAARILSAAGTELPVLILGESGTGKDVTARALHQASCRRQLPFVAVNMAGLSEGLSAAELFGCVKGAYTGAEARSGYVRDAHNGTLFLDEIADTPETTQTQLLRFLEQGEVQVLGGRCQSVDVRVIAATDGSVTADTGFRHALLTRLSAYRIQLCPLRNRLEDIGPQAICRLVGVSSEATRWPVASASEQPEVAAHWGRFFFRALLRDWPGNSRELGFAIERASRDDPAVAPALERRSGVSRGHQVDDNEEHDALAVAYRRCRFDKAATATQLGLSRATVHRRIREHPDLVLVEDLSDDQITAALNHCDDLEGAAFTLGVSSRALRPRLKHLNLMP